MNTKVQVGFIAQNDNADGIVRVVDDQAVTVEWEADGLAVYSWHEIEEFGITFKPAVRAIEYGERAPQAGFKSNMPDEG